MPDATIVIPCYNALAYAGDAIQSALAQTCRNIEVIAVDDQSTDATFALLHRLAAGDTRLRVVQTPRNGGPAAACNMGYDLARGDWVAVLDSDDLWLPERIERLIAIAQARNADMIADNLLQQDFDTGANLGLHFPDAEMRCDEPLTLLEMLRRDMPDMRGAARLGFVQPLIRRDLLRRHRLRFSPEIRAGEDFLHYFECVAHGARFVLTPEAHYVYRIRSNSLTLATTSPYFNAAANRRMTSITQRLGSGAAVLEALARRQRLLDVNCLARAAGEGEVLKALGYLRLDDRATLLRQLRIIGGALRRRFAEPRASTFRAPASGSGGGAIE